MQSIVYNRMQDYKPTQTAQAQTYLFVWQVILKYSKNAVLHTSRTLFLFFFVLCSTRKRTKTIAGLLLPSHSGLPIMLWRSAFCGRDGRRCSPQCTCSCDAVMRDSTVLHPSFSSVTASAPIGRGFTPKSQTRKDVIFKQQNQWERNRLDLLHLLKNVFKKIWICIAKVLKKHSLSREHEEGKQLLGANSPAAGWLHMCLHSIMPQSLLSQHDQIFHDSFCCWSNWGAAIYLGFWQLEQAVVPPIRHQ